MDKLIFGMNLSLDGYVDGLSGNSKPQIRTLWLGR